jgi:hypothetical protein
VPALRTAVALGLLAVLQSFAEERIKVDLPGARGEIVFVAYPGPDHKPAQLLEQSGPASSPSGTGTRSIANLWRCGDGVFSGPRLFVFGGDRAPIYLEPKEICGQLSTGGQLTLELPPPTQVKLFVWMRDPKMRSLVMDEVANANWLARHNRAGVVFKPDILLTGFGGDFKYTKVGPDPNVDGDDSKFLIARPPYAPRQDWAPIHESDPDTNCETLAPNAKLLRTGGMNVFVGFQDGWTCLEGRDVDNVIFIPDSGKPLGVLAHELAHASGVGSDLDGVPGFVYETGHVPPKVGNTPVPHLFPAHNALVQDAIVLHETLTLGQVFWMNFSSQSYVAQVRAKNGRPNFACPNLDLCPGYDVDFEVPRKAAEFNHACPVQSFSAGLGSKFALTNGLNKELAEQQPHYCTEGELLDALTGRFQNICGPSNRELGGNFCGHGQKDFVSFWSKRFAVAGAVQVASFAALNALLNHTPAAPGTSVYQEMAASAQRDAARLVSNQTALTKKLKGKRLLWIDSRDNNRFEAALLEAVGLQIDFREFEPQLARETGDWRSRYALLISPRRDRQAMNLLELLQRERIHLPLLIYARRVGEFGASAGAAKGGRKELLPFVETDRPGTLIDCIFQAAGSKVPACRVQP